jgi:cell division septation protein DedD
MQRSMREEELDSVGERRDTEFTLGPALLMGLGLGLILLCGVCFWFGYAAGRRSSTTQMAAAAQSATGQPAQSQVANALSKPPAAGMIPSAPAQPAAADLPQAPTTDGNQPANPLTSYAPAANGSNAEPSQPQVRPALQQQASGSQPVSAAASALQVQPAMVESAGLMVQIAAVSHAEDASVLVAALRRRGYAVTARREPADSLIHVQVGPFANRNDANAMCQRLLGDGYNAIVQP